MSKCFPYGIIDGASEVIALFKHDSDRDLCMDAMIEEYPDCVFRARNDEETDNG